MLMSVPWTMPGALTYAPIVLEATYVPVMLGMTLIPTDTTAQVNWHKLRITD